MRRSVSCNDSSGFTRLDRYAERLEGIPNDARNANYCTREDPMVLTIDGPHQAVKHHSCPLVLRVIVNAPRLIGCPEDQLLGGDALMPGQ
jgi:hypothetical protein